MALRSLIFQNMHASNDLLLFSANTLWMRLNSCWFGTTLTQQQAMETQRNSMSFVRWWRVMFHRRKTKPRMCISEIGQSFRLIHSHISPIHTQLSVCAVSGWMPIFRSNITIDRSKGPWTYISNWQPENRASVERNHNAQQIRHYECQGNGLGQPFILAHVLLHSIQSICLCSYHEKHNSWRYWQSNTWTKRVQQTALLMTNDANEYFEWIRIIHYSFTKNGRMQSHGPLANVKCSIIMNR